MSKPELTEEELAERDAWIEDELIEGKDGIKALAKHNRHTTKELKEIEKHYRKIERREVKTIKHGVEIDVTEAMFINVVRLSRGFTPANLQGIWDGLVNPTDLSVYADRFGSDEDVS